MDKNQILGFVLIFAVLIGWSIITSPSKEEIEQRKRAQDSIEQIKLVEEVKVSEETKAVEEDIPSLPVVSDSAAV